MTPRNQTETLFLFFPVVPATGATQLFLLGYHLGFPLVILLEVFWEISPATDILLWPQFPVSWLPRSNGLPSCALHISASTGRDCISKVWRQGSGAQEKNADSLYHRKTVNLTCEVFFLVSLCTSSQQVRTAVANLRSPAHMALLYALHECYINQIFCSAWRRGDWGEASLQPTTSLWAEEEGTGTDLFSVDSREDRA